MGSSWPGVESKSIKGAGGRPCSLQRRPRFCYSQAQRTQLPSKGRVGRVICVGGLPASCALALGAQALPRGHGWWLLVAIPQLLQVDVSTLDVGSSRLDSAVALCFGPAPTNHLLVSTLSNKVVVLDSTSGRVVREVSPGP